MNASKFTSIARPLILSLFALATISGVSQADAATFKVERSISFDQWVTWPDESRWNEDEVLNNFPEWQKFVSDAEIDGLKNLGLTTVRVPIDPAVFLFDDEPDRVSKLFQNVHTAIERIQRAGLNVIIDMHTIPYDGDRNIIGISQILNDDLIFVAYKRLLSDFAQELVKYDPSAVALEIINEPNYDCTKRDMAALWQAQATQLHGAVRAANNNITIIIPGGCYASAKGMAQLNPKAFSDENIIWTFHNYEPFIITHQSADWVGEPVSAFKNLPYPPSKLTTKTIQNMPGDNANYIDRALPRSARSDAGWYIRNTLSDIAVDEKLQELLKEPFEIAAKWADENSIAREDIFLGEFGFIAQEYNKDFKTDPAWRLAYLNDMIGLANEYGFGWSIWSYGGAFGMAQTFGGEAMPGDLLKRLDLNNSN